MKLNNALRLLDALDVWDGGAAREEFAKIKRPEIVWRVAYYIICLHVEINVPGTMGFDRLLPERRIKRSKDKPMHVNRELIQFYTERAENLAWCSPSPFVPNERGPFEELVFNEAMEARAAALNLSLPALCAHDIIEGKDWRYPRHER
jgi:hypothetical protein